MDEEYLRKRKKIEKYANARNEYFELKNKVYGIKSKSFVKCSNDEIKKGYSLESSLVALQMLEAIQRHELASVEFIVNYCQTKRSYKNSDGVDEVLKDKFLMLQTDEYLARKYHKSVRGIKNEIERRIKTLDI